ncbi:MAG: hypothetical protein HY835_02080, partial [Anaerolineae bacterium]|nr:hypothetical protein [Anaerolineae bacterium]
MKRLTILQNTPLLAVLLCVVAVGFWLVASRFSGTQVELSSLDQLHLITSLAYLLLLSGVSGLRIAVAARRSIPVTILPDSLVILLGYILPGLIGLLPVLIDAGVYWYLPRMLWEMFTSPSLVWVPVTQVAALILLQSQIGQTTMKAHPTQRTLPWQTAALAGGGLLLGCVFVYQMSEVALARTLQPVPATPLHLLLAFVSAMLMPVFSESFLRGRLANAG